MFVERIKLKGFEHYLGKKFTRFNKISVEVEKFNRPNLKPNPTTPNLFCERRSFYVDDNSLEGLCILVVEIEIGGGINLIIVS